MAQGRRETKGVRGIGEGDSMKQGKDQAASAGSETGKKGAEQSVAGHTAVNEGKEIDRGCEKDM